MSASLILASGSAVRQTLLKNAGLIFDAKPAKVDEREVEQNLPERQRDPISIARHLAVAKAQDVSANHPNVYVIGCDQTMSLGERVFHKASSLEEARSTLETLRGKTHALNSAVCLVKDGEVLWETVVSAKLHVRQFSEEWLNQYLIRNGASILSSVGCYQLEGEGVQLFERIDGDYFTILGLPLLPLLEALREQGINHA